MFGDLTPPSLDLLEKIKQARRLGKGARFFSRGDRPRGFFLLREGRAQLIFRDYPKGKRIARLIAPNELFGLTEALAELPYETAAETLTPCLCEFIERGDFIGFLRNEPRLCFRLGRFLALRFHQNFRHFLR